MNAWLPFMVARHVCDTRDLLSLALASTLTVPLLESRQRLGVMINVLDRRFRERGIVEDFLRRAEERKRHPWLCYSLHLPRTRPVLVEPDDREDRASDALVLLINEPVLCTSAVREWDALADANGIARFPADRSADTIWTVETDVTGTFHIGRALEPSVDHLAARCTAGVPFFLGAPPCEEFPAFALLSPLTGYFYKVKGAVPGEVVTIRLQLVYYANPLRHKMIQCFAVPRRYMLASGEMFLE